MNCARCDELLDEVSRLQAESAAAREDASERRWERDHAIESYRKVAAELLAFQAKYYAGGHRG